MGKSTPVHVERKACDRCACAKPVEMFPVRGRGRARVCIECRDAEPIPTHMTCTGGCGKTKPVEEFCRMGDGYKKPCKECHRKAGRKPGSLPRKRYPIPPDGHKWCTKCDECKSLDRFPPSKTTRTGRGSWCSECFSRHIREQYQIPEVREDRLARRKRWGYANPDYHIEWRQNNLERARANGRAGAARRRARKQGLPVESYTVAQLVERDGTVCVLCGEELDWDALPNRRDSLAVTVEHLECLAWPHSVGGDRPSNVALSHYSCNVRRGTKPHPAAARKRAELLAAEQEATV